MKVEIAEARRLVSEGKREAAMALAGQKKARGAKKMELAFVIIPDQVAGAELLPDGIVNSAPGQIPEGGVRT